MDIMHIPTANHFDERAGYNPRWLILHGTAGGNSAQAIAEYFKSTEGTNNPVSSHYIIDQSGVIVQCVDEIDGAYGNGILEDGHDPWWSNAINPNYLTISIEHVKVSDDNSNPLSDAQRQASFALIDDICTRWSIPKRKADAYGGITGHFSIAPQNRQQCPGTFPWSDLWSELQKGRSMIPVGWKDDGTTLTAPNGVNVVRGFRNYIINNGWDSGNWPLEVEQEATPLEIGNPGLGNGTQQLFRWSMLGWTAQRGVFVEWIGQELLATRKLLQMHTTPQNVNIDAATTTISAIVNAAQTIEVAAKNALSDLGK